MQDKSAASLAFELVKRIRLPSLPTIYWILRIGLLVATILAFKNYREIIDYVGDKMGALRGDFVEKIEQKQEDIKEELKEEISTEFNDFRDDQKGYFLEAIEEDRQNRCRTMTAEQRRFHGCQSSTEKSKEPLGNEGIEDTGRLKIMPSAPLSDKDRIIKHKDESLYRKEYKSNAITPSNN